MYEGPAAGGGSLPEDVHTHRHLLTTFSLVPYLSLVHFFAVVEVLHLSSYSSEVVPIISLMGC